MSLPPPTPLVPLIPNHKVFKHFTGNFSGKPEGQLKALIAVGLYAEAECLWAEQLTPPPGIRQIAQYHQIASTPHQLRDIEKEVETLLNNFSNELVDLYQKQQLKSTIKNVEDELRARPREFWYGVKQALVGAACYTVLLIGVSWLAKWGGIDLFAVFGRVSGGP